MAIVIVSLVALCLVVASVAVHYEALRLASAAVPRLRVPPRTRILAVLAVAFVAHLAEIGIFAFAYWAMELAGGLGHINGAVEGGALDYLYFSAASFTTLGVGDIVATGPLRVVAGIEPVAGLVLITWSASFTYLAMERFWQDHR
jgi:hypothetical protein